MKLRLLISVGLFVFRCVIGWETVYKDRIVADDNLIMAHTICRHGDRNALADTYPIDPWNSLQYWPGGFGELTNLGKQQLFVDGEYFRMRYAKLIGNDGYNPNKVYIQSTDKDRTLMSAQANSAGLFPPTPAELWNEDLAWQPIPVHAISQKLDHTLGLFEPCERFDYLMVQFAKTAAFQDLLKKNQVLIRNLEECVGELLPTIVSIGVLYDALNLEQNKGFPLPTCANEAFNLGNNFGYLATKSYEVYTESSDMKKLRSGYLLKEILNHFKSKVESTLSPDRSLWMYFAHDYTLAYMLNSLGLFWLHTPPYASCILFELYQNDTEPYVQIFYKNSTIPIIPAMNIPKCGTKCPLEKMYDLYGDILPTRSYEDECKLRDGEVLPPYSETMFP